MNRRRRLVLRRRTSTQSQNSFDERSQPLSFARPAENHSLTISATFPPRRIRDPPLPSPSVSEASRAESVDGAPSLISDNGTAFSVSPRLRYSPGSDIPRLPFTRPDTRRPSLPLLQFRQSNFHSEADAQTASFSRFHNESNYALSALSPPVYRRMEQYPQNTFPSSPRDYHHHESIPRAQLPTAPPSPVQLAPLQLLGQAPGKPRDTRMHLSSLLD